MFQNVQSELQKKKNEERSLSKSQEAQPLVLKNSSRDINVYRHLPSTLEDSPVSSLPSNGMLRLFFRVEDQHNKHKAGESNKSFQSCKENYPP